MSLSLDLDSIAYVFSAVLVHIAVPFWIITAPGLPKVFPFVPYRSIWRGMFVATLLMWPLMLLCRCMVEEPYIMSRSNAPSYNRGAVSMFILAFGGPLALILQLPHVLLRLLLRWISWARRQKEKPLSRS